MSSTAESSTTALKGDAGPTMLNRRDHGKPDKLLVNQEEAALLENGFGNEKGDVEGDDEKKVPSEGLSARDKRAITLLVALYLLQGIPVGLAFGSIPFLLRSKLSYSQIGLFSLSTYPYSLKLLWSPIVDSWFSPKIGRRKTWIIPIQLMVGVMMWWLGSKVPGELESAEPNIKLLTAIFFSLVFLAATQDIAVDGWALTLLSRDNLSYASTAQTIGLNCGYFLSFTVFLAFNSLDFSNAYFRSEPLPYPLVSLQGYLRFWSVAFIVVTLYLAFFQPEDPPVGVEEEMDTKKVYSIMWQICQLKHVQVFIAIHLLNKIGTSTNDAATSLKLLERGLKKEDLALAVLIDFPFQLWFGYLAAKWSKGDKPLRPWLVATWSRLGWAMISMILIRCFPQPAALSVEKDVLEGAVAPSGTSISKFYFFLVVFCTVGSSFSSTVQFVGVSAFHTQIADPFIGGTYMTLLNTVSNLGGTWPRYFVLKGIDQFTKAECVVREAGAEITIRAQECVSEHGQAACSALGGTCVTARDGYYYMSSISIVIAAGLLWFFIGPNARKLQSVPPTGWRIKKVEA